MDMTIEQSEQVKNFVKACNGFIKGKFILTDIKIANILKAIAESELIYNLLAEQMINFDYEHELKKCCVKTGIDGGSFNLPKEESLIIPLVFCLLVQIDSKRIDFNYFLRTQFPYAENQNEQYDRFAQEVIVPFRNCIASKFDISTIEEEKKPEKPAQNIIDKRIEQRGGLFIPQPEVNFVQPQENEDVEKPETVVKPKTEFDKFLEQILLYANEINQNLGYIKKYDRSENIRLVLKALIKSCEIKDIDLINGLLVALIELAQKEKALRDDIDCIKVAYAKFIENQD